MLDYINYQPDLYPCSCVFGTVISIELYLSLQLSFFVFCNSDYDYKQDMAKAVLAAAKGGYEKIMRCILQKDETVLLEELPDCNGNCLLVEAMTEGLSSLFQVCNVPLML